MSNIRKGLFAFCVRKTDDFLIEACGKCLKILSPIEDLQLQHAQADDILHPEQEQQPNRPPPEAVKSDPIVRSDKKVGRNEPCPCGSGKKYKHCCGKLS